MAIAILIDISVFIFISFSVVIGFKFGIKSDDEYKGEKAINPRPGFVINVGLKTYFMDTAGKSWGNARRYCESQNMILAKVQEQLEVDELNKNLSQANIVYCVDGGEEMKIVSADMKPLEIKAIYPWQPTFCLSFQTALPTFSIPPELRSDFCTASYPVLCQSKPPPIITSVKKTKEIYLA